MKSLLIALMLGFDASSLAAIPQGRPGDAERAAVLPPVAGGGCWCRTATGRWIWVAPSSEVPGSNPAQASSGGGIYIFRPNGMFRHQHNFRPDSVNGIKWYLNGRSYFSD